MLPKTLYKFLIHFLRPFRWTFYGMLFAVVLHAVLTSLSPYFLKLILDGVVSVPEGEKHHLLKAILVPAVLFVLLYQAMDLCWALYDYFKLKTLPRVRENIINSLFSYLQKHSYSYFQKNFSGSLSNKVSDMARGSESVIAQAVEPMFSQIMCLVIAIFSMYLVHPFSSMVLLLWSVVFLGIVVVCYHKMLRYSEVFSESHSVAMGKLVDSVTNIINVKLFARSRFEHEYLSQYVQDAREKDTNLQWYTFKVKIMQGVSVTLLFGFMVGALIYARERGLVTVGDFAFILTLAMTVMQGLWYLASHFLTFSQELGVCKQALSIINVPHEITDAANAQPLMVTRGEIVFDHVTFNYERGKNLFKDQSIIIQGGQKVGLVGFSGSGKTTFVNLILRFYEISSGKILIDGQDIREVTQESLHAQISVIPQEPLLFHRSIFENIAYGKIGATKEEVIEASKLAHCHEFIEAWPEGYHTIVGERGMKLSGGQRQRLAIARAILKNAPILILDEATSALDSITEEQIRESVEYLMQGRTTFVIAHRLSTLTDMSRILVFTGGHVAEDGTHEELMELNGHYAKLWALQADGFLPEQGGGEEEYEEEEAVS